MKIQIEIQNCDQCPKAKIEKVNTSDSWEYVRKIECTVSDKLVYPDLDWNEHSPVPVDCPLKINE